MGQRLARPQTDFLVQHTLEEGLGRKLALHIHIRFAVVNHLHGLECRLLIVLLIHNLHVRQIDAALRCDRTDFVLIAEQDRICDTLGLRLLRSLQDILILRDADRKSLGRKGLDLSNNVFKRCTHDG